MIATTREGRVGRLLRLGVSNGSRSAADDPTALEALETELALLREENAALKVERHRPLDSGGIIERMRGLQDPSHTAATIPDGLLEACHDVRQAMRVIQDRLGGLAIDAPGSGEKRHGSTAAASAPTGEVELDLAVEAQVTSDLTQKAA